MFPLPIISNTSIAPPPIEPEGTMLFGLYDFYSTDDIKDRSSNQIPIILSDEFTVGSNEYGTYIDFTTGTQYITITSNILKLTEYDIYLEFTDVHMPTQPMCLLDSRTSSSGKQLLLSYPANSNIIQAWAGGEGGSAHIDTPFESTRKNLYRLKVRVSTGSETFLNNEPVSTSSAKPVLTDGRIVIGANVYTTAQRFIGNLHSFKIYYPYTNEYERFKAEVQYYNSTGAWRAQTTEQSFNYNWGGHTAFSVQMVPPVDEDITNKIMNGSPHGTNSVGETSSLYRMLQHAYPTYEMFLDGIENQDVCMYIRGGTGNHPVLSIDRNGYVSDSTVNANRAPVTKFVYYDRNTGYVMTYNPYTMSVPVRYYA